ncbi:PREDICTED: uncharacterized protein LOC105364098 [Ceratosolen solmsi marchali]|uniref:Uncharacterized protein LOC105364098 n=1 Tax=Ceratosolen solmsi marchali TaxID=326594 RepID=A0AAJ6YLI3_9HYME|nr:PREDICTED: uncharacterized protein LOC105364098 [Ceratosolen solmsi marchali]
MEEDDNTSWQNEDNESTSVTSVSIAYHSEDFISKPRLSENGTVPFNILEFIHSFGYDCRKRFNLCVADPNTLIFASGNLIHFFNIENNIITFRRCSTGGGIGDITKNSVFNHIAIGENGVNPPLIIYEWPSMEIVTVLHKGTTCSYSTIRYSPDGLRLVSQGGDPDYLITIWDWQRSTVVLQCKSHGQDVFNVVFSHTLHGHMTTCGSGHIKCWKMSETFTGLKLQGELGRFGKTEISDIVSVYPMPDEKIISGCEWGNILVWAEGLIKIEVSRKNKKPCHDGYVSQFEYVNGELISIGTDGRICVWYYETIDIAMPSETSNILEIEPIYEFQISSNEKSDYLNSAMLMQILKQDQNDPDNGIWYAQDGSGGIWLLHLLEDMHQLKYAKQLFYCHADSVLDMDTSDWGPYIVTIGQDSYLHLYNYHERTLILRHRFNELASHVIWLPCSVGPTGSIIICAFNSGVIRIFNLALFDFENNDAANVKLIQALKPHTMKITCMSINPNNKLLATAGEDNIVFVFNIKVEESRPNLIPIGYIEIPSHVTFMTWKPDYATTLFMGCLYGDCIEVTLPEEPQTYTTKSYKLVECNLIIFKFQSVKSFIIREQVREIAEKEKQQKLAEKKEELRIMREENPGIDIDEELFLEEGIKEDFSLPDIYIPEVPNAVLLAMYTTRNSILLSMAGYDAGFMYEYTNPEPNNKTVHINSYLIDDGNDDEIRSFLYFQNRKYVIFGMEHGEIRVCKVNPENVTDFSNYWVLPMHDNFNGIISSICLSYDQTTLITCGHDGNIFSYYINDDSPAPEIDIPVVKPASELFVTDVADIEDLDYLSLEDEIVLIEKNRILANAKENKTKTYAMLHELNEKYNSVLKKNNALPLSQRLTDEELQLDPRVIQNLNVHLDNEMDLVYKKLEHNVEKHKLKLKKLMDHFIEPITCLPFAVQKILKPDTMVHSLRELKLTEAYLIDRQYIPKEEESIAVHKTETLDFQSEIDATKFSRSVMNEELYNDKGAMITESFLKDLSPRTIQFHLTDEINQLLKKYRCLKKKLKEEEEEWKVLEAQKPNLTAMNPEDESVIEHVKRTIGDFKLKSSLNFDNMSLNFPTISSKSVQIIDYRRKIHFRRENFNNRLKDLRTKKIELRAEVKKLTIILNNIHLEIPENAQKPVPNLPEIDEDVEFPEHNLKLETYVLMEDRVKETKMKKQTNISALPVHDMDEEYEVLLLDPLQSESTQNGINYNTNAKIRAVRNTVPANVLAAIEEAEKVDSKLEREMKRARVVKKIYEQDQILNHVYKSYKSFDKELDKLEKERFEIVYETIYVNLFILTIHQELIVLRKFEKMEMELNEIINSNQKAKIKEVSCINNFISKVEDKTFKISKIQEKINENSTRYINSIKNNKYYRFLKKICQKKYKTHSAEADASSESESSMSISSSDDDMGKDSDASDNLETIHLDENICPPECNRQLYDEAFILREMRYEMESRIHSKQSLINNWKQKIDVHRKRLKMIDVELQENRDKLQLLLTDKQNQLNDIDITVILKLHQLQCFTEGDKPENIQNCIIFDKNRLSQLYARVGQLENETAEQMTKYKNDKIHLRKIKVSCELMKEEIDKLKRKIKKKMQQKFGQQISLVTLYEAVLRRLIDDIKANTSSLVKFYDNKIKSIKNEYTKKLEVLKDLIKDNTEKLSILTVLEEELLKLRKTLNVKLMSEEEINKLELEYKSELGKLKRILKEQEKHMDCVSRDIIFLSNKSKHLLPIEELKLDIDKENRRAASPLLDGEEQDLINHAGILSRGEMSVSKSSDSSIDDNSEYKKVIAVRHMLSHITAIKETDTTETIDQMLTEVTDNLNDIKTREEKLERDDNEIIEISDEEEGCSEISSKDDIDDLADITNKYINKNVESMEGSFVQEIEPDIRNRLDELFLNIGIEDNSGEISHNLIHKLRVTEDIDCAINYILDKLPSDIDDEKRSTYCKRIKPFLINIMKLIEIKNFEAIENQEGDF